METVRYLITLKLLSKRREQFSLGRLANSESRKYANTPTFLFNDLGIEN